MHTLDLLIIFRLGHHGQTSQRSRGESRVENKNENERNGKSERRHTQTEANQECETTVINLTISKNIEDTCNWRVRRAFSRKSLISLITRTGRQSGRQAAEAARCQFESDSWRQNEILVLCYDMVNRVSHTWLECSM